ncbi:MAG: amidohydrolase family protein [Ornithinimicrobium sp.]
MEPSIRPLFDAHLHIIDPRFPLVTNQGYRPPPFTVEDYHQRTQGLNLTGGAVVSGSFQGVDQTYLLAALAELGHGFVGVTQLPAEATDDEIRHLDRAGVRAVRANQRRGDWMTPRQLDRIARRVHDLVGWHLELYVDAADLTDLVPTLTALPTVSIDHLGLSTEGLPGLLDLAEAGVYVKATGFSRGNLDIPATLTALANTNPHCLVVGTDLPSTRAPEPFTSRDLELVAMALEDPALIHAAFAGNAQVLYGQEPTSGSS